MSSLCLKYWASQDVITSDSMKKIILMFTIIMSWTLVLVDSGWSLINPYPKVLRIWLKVGILAHILQIPSLHLLGVQQNSIKKHELRKVIVDGRVDRPSTLWWTVNKVVTKMNLKRLIILEEMDGAMYR